MKKKSIFAALVALMFALGAMPAWSQATLARVGGKVSDGGKPVVGAKVVITNKDSGRQYVAKTDKKGEFTQIGFTRGNNYSIEIFNAEGTSIYTRGGVAIINEGGKDDFFLIDVSNTNATNLGMNTEGVSAGHKQTKEEAEEAAKQKQAQEAAIEGNKKAESENALIAQLNPAIQAKNWAVAEPLLIQLSTINPNRWDFLQSLGEAQFNQGKYEEAVATYLKAIPMAQNSSDPKADPLRAKNAVGQMLTQEGNAYLKLKKNKEAIDAYNQAASLSPNPGTAYFNICAVQYNAGNMEGAAVACDKAIAADPNKADAYFIKGSSLYGNGKLDKDNKYVVPPGTTEALNKYLELAPDGAHAADVKAMLQALGLKIETTYKERKGK
jgi:tetratricopeptide (TPR) repeat protein